MAEKAPPKFLVQRATIGDGYLIVYCQSGAPPMQINNIFETEREANKWIASESANWLASRGIVLS